MAICSGPRGGIKAIANGRFGGGKSQVAMTANGLMRVLSKNDAVLQSIGSSRPLSDIRLSKLLASKRAFEWA